MNIDPWIRREQRNFGLVMAVAIVVLGLIRWAIQRETPPWAFVYVAIPFAALGLVWPRALGPVLWVWIRVALVLNWIMTHVMLTIVWCLLITPTRFLISLFSEDPLQRKWSSESETYWEEPDDQPEDLDSYFRQF